MTKRDEQLSYADESTIKRIIKSMAGKILTTGAKIDNTSV